MFEFLVKLFELNEYKSDWLKYAIDEFLSHQKDLAVAAKLLNELNSYDKDTAAAFEFYLGEMK